MMHERIYVRFAYNGNIRTWDRCPFPGGVEYVRADLLAAAQAEVREHLLAVTEGEPIKGVGSARDMDGTEDKRASWSKVTNEDVRRWHSHLTEALALINAQEHAQEPAAEKPAERDAAEAQGVPDGCVLVPAEPTPEMRQAATAAVGPYISLTCWDAMLAAAPQFEEYENRGLQRARAGGSRRCVTTS